MNKKNALYTEAHQCQVSQKERKLQNRKANQKFANEVPGLFDHNFSGNRTLPTRDRDEVHTIAPFS